MNVIKNLRCKTSSLANYSQYLIVLCLCFYYFYLSRKIGLSTENGGPDEIARSLLPRCIVNGNPYPSANDSCSVYHLGNYSYAVYPQLLAAYVSAFFMTIAKVFGATEPQIFQAGRLASVFFASISLIAISKTISFFIFKKSWATNHYMPFSNITRLLAPICLLSFLYEQRHCWIGRRCPPYPVLSARHL